MATMNIRAGFAGAGALAVPLKAIERARGGFAGSGTLDTSLRSTAIAPVFAGAGALGAPLRTALAARALFAGAGAMTAPLLARTQLTAGFAGAGGLIAPLLTTAVTPYFAGAGALDAAVRGPISMAAALAGAGALTGASIATMQVRAALPGAGEFSSYLIGPWHQPMLFAGAGRLRAGARLLGVTIGVKMCLPFTHETWPEIRYGTVPAASDDVDLISNIDIIGARFGEHGYISYPWSDFGGQPPSTWTMEAIVHLDSGREGYIAGFTENASGGGMADRTLFIADGLFGIYTDGGVIQHGVAAPGEHHLIVVSTTTSMTLYVKGQGSATTVVNGGGLSDYPVEPFFTVGQASSLNNVSLSYLPSGPARAFRGVMLLAMISNRAYSTGEVAARLSNPFSSVFWQQPDIETITDADLTKGWDAGFWDVTPAPVAPPNIDALTLALFQGGYLDLRPAGVTVEYVTQSLAGTPIFAMDVQADIDYDDLTYFSWDGNDAEGFDFAVWDVTQPGFTSSVRAPPTYTSGWDIGAWGTFRAPIVPA